ncbi:N-acetylglucosamine kinase [Microvirga flavescens]|uniref:N-acetylglucosamine kinase n=1 Tax=Microvirga flavescens TaxID=2249811 RepID=UPI000DDB03D0|nr:BadF/BadG/BcrA/BcrD ATPase family protein [Microvirga flavescens]
MALGLGIDAGGTATRWRLCDEKGECVAQGTADPLSGHLFSAAAEERARDIIASIANAVAAHGKPSGIVAGITGLTRDTPAEILVRDMLADAFKVASDKIFVAEDMWIAYLSYFALGEGILVYSGTGSIGYYLAEDKTVLRVGGRGNLIDDAGSGFWIAREALKAVLRQEEESPGEGWATPLGQALAQPLGGTDWNVVRAYVYGGDRGKIGTLARAVAEAAQGGDAVALNILRDAGQELARLANSLIKRVGPRPVALVGGGSRLHPIVAQAFREKLSPPVEVITSDVDAAMTAARLAATVQ